jgi:hypothetical protein
MMIFIFLRFFQRNIIHHIQLQRFISLARPSRPRMACAVEMRPVLSAGAGCPSGNLSRMVWKEV